MFLFISPSCRERIINKHLNTSHVLIYPMRQNRVYILPSFKYISCSYLSGAIPRNMKRIGLFKYISCSYLSGISKIIGGSQSYLNTSHVLIYQDYAIRQLTEMEYLNTSHVLIYPTFLRTSCFL